MSKYDVYVDEGLERTKEAQAAVMAAVDDISPLFAAMQAKGWQLWQAGIILEHAVQYKSVMLSLGLGDDEAQR